MDALATILADMLRCALTWEQNHGQLPPGDCEGALTGTLRGVYNSKTRTSRGGKQHDHDKDTQETKLNDDLRGPQKPES